MDDLFLFLILILILIHLVGKIENTIGYLYSESDISYSLPERIESRYFKVFLLVHCSARGDFNKAPLWYLTECGGWTHSSLLAPNPFYFSTLFRALP